MFQNPFSQFCSYYTSLLPDCKKKSRRWSPSPPPPPEHHFFQKAVQPFPPSKKGENPVKSWGNGAFIPRWEFIDNFNRGGETCGKIGGRGWFFPGIRRKISTFVQLSPVFSPLLSSSEEGGRASFPPSLVVRRTSAIQSLMRLSACCIT